MKHERLYSFCGCLAGFDIIARMLRPCQRFSGYSQDATFVNNKYLTDALAVAGATPTPKKL